MPPEMDRALFVYGSLQPGGEYWPRYCAGRVVEQQRARVRGRLYKCGNDYLALREPAGQPGEPWVRGWRFVLNNADALYNIDQLEGFNPDRPAEDNDYLRVRIDCFADDSSPNPKLIGQVWVYTMTPEQITRAGAVEVSPSEQ